jgi:hypothetical protein
MIYQPNDHTGMIWNRPEDTFGENMAEFDGDVQLSGRFLDAVRVQGNIAVHMQLHPDCSEASWLVSVIFRQRKRSYLIRHYGDGNPLVCEVREGLFYHKRPTLGGDILYVIRNEFRCVPLKDSYYPVISLF